MKVIEKPNITLYEAVRVDKDTTLEYKNEYVNQTLKDFVLNSETKLEGEGYKSKLVSEIYLTDGDILVFANEQQGWVKPIQGMYEVKEAIEELENIKEV